MGQGGSQMSLSVLAVLSLVFAILCLTAPLGVVLGVGALASIQLSRGRKYGRGLAIAGIVIGLLFSSVLVGVLVGAASLTQSYARNVFKPGETLVRAIEARDWKSVRAVLEPGADGRLSDAQLESFADAVSARMGTFSGLDLSNWKWGTTGHTGGGGFDLKNAVPLPMPGNFANGSAVVMFLVDGREWSEVVLSGRTMEKRVLNVVIMPDHGQPLLLSDEGVKLGGSGGAAIPPIPPPPAPGMPPLPPVLTPEKPAVPGGG